MLLKLILKNISKNKLIAFISILVLSMVIFFSSFLNFIYANIQTILVNESIWQKENIFTLEAKKWSYISSKLWLEEDLQSYYKKLKQDENINEVFWVYQVNIPVQAVLDFFDMNFKTDILVFAVDNYTWNKEYLSIWISPTLLNLYNTQIANDFLPMLDKNILKKIKIKLSFWKNSFIQFDNIEEKTWYITHIDNNFPLLWISIPYEKAKNIQEKLWRWDIKLIKIIWYVKENSYLQNIKKTYENKLNIKTVSDAKIKINQQTKIVKDIFYILRYIVYMIMASFLILLAINIYHKNEKNIKVFYYHGANFLQRFNILFYEISIYFLTAVLISFLVVWFFNIYIIDIINTKLESYGLYNIHINWISFENIIFNSIISFIIIMIIFLLVFIRRTTKKL